MTLQEAYEIGFYFTNCVLNNKRPSPEKCVGFDLILSYKTDKQPQFYEAYQLGKFRAKINNNETLNETLNENELNHLTKLCFNLRTLEQTTDLLNYLKDNNINSIKRYKLLRKATGTANSFVDYLENSNQTTVSEVKETIQEYIDELQSIVNQF